MSSRKSLSKLFLELAQPDDEGYSRPVYVREFTGEYEGLKLGNGGSWCRRESALAQKYKVERHKAGTAIDYVQLHGYNSNPQKWPIRTA